jgi:cytochrome oxidase Cu insertion factor (SCO1/SenC/PrrC family)
MEKIVSKPENQRASRSRTQLVLIWVLFLLPPLSAWVAWKYLGEQGVAVTTNAGTLVSPARPLQMAGLRQADGTPFSDKQLRGRWTYVVFAGGDCGEVCQQQLYLTRQTRIAMSKDIRRVQRLLVLGRQPAAELMQLLQEEQPDLHWVVRGEQAGPLMQQFSGEGFGPAGEQYFLIDPLGNLMMFYDLEVPAKGLMKDLQKLLKVSQIG